MKGKFNGICNRGACDNGDATYYNHSTQGYYCRPCALRINQASAGQPWHPLCFKRVDENQLDDFWKYKRQANIVPDHIILTHAEISKYLHRDDVVTDTPIDILNALDKVFKLAWEADSARRKKESITEGRYLSYITDKGLQETEISFDYFLQNLYIYSNGAQWQASFYPPLNGWVRTEVRVEKNSTKPTTKSQEFADKITIDYRFEVYLSEVQYKRVIECETRRPNALNANRIPAWKLDTTGDLQ